MNGAYREPPQPPGFAQFAGLGPDGSGPAWFIIALSGLAGSFKDSRNRNKQLEGFLVPETVREPRGIWIDLKSPGKERWMAYVRKPSGRFHGDTSIVVPCLPGMVFAVYVRDRLAKHGQYVIDSWEWVEADNEVDGFPIDHPTRYGRLLWKQDFPDTLTS